MMDEKPGSCELEGEGKRTGRLLLSNLFGGKGFSPIRSASRLKKHLRGRDDTWEWTALSNRAHKSIRLLAGEGTSGELQPPNIEEPPKR